MPFQLHPQLAKDTVLFGGFPLCQLLLLNNKTVPWFILTPQTDVQEIYELDLPDRRQFDHESDQIAGLLKRCFHAHKLNIASIGNIVPQLHIHHIARFTDDPLWPNVVWGNVQHNPYTVEGVQQIKDKLKTQLTDFTWR